MKRSRVLESAPSARALEVIGSRWTILIVRDLLTGPRRFTDLQSALPGIAPSMLTDRLRNLRECGVIRQVRLPAPSAASVYELTDLGQALRPVVAELDGWGMHMLGLKPGNRFRLAWLLRCLEASFRPALARHLYETYEYRIGEDVFHIRIDDGTARAHRGPARDPAFSMESDVDTFLALGASVTVVEEAVACDLARLTGDMRAAERAVALLGPNFDAVGADCGILGAVRSTFNSIAAQGLYESYEFRVGEQTFHARVSDGAIEMRLGLAEDAAVILATDLYSLLALGAGLQPAPRAAAEGSVIFSGDRDALSRMAAVFGLPTTN